MSNWKDSAEYKKLMDYLREQNPPPSVTDVFCNLMNGNKPPASINSLELLLGGGPIYERAYGKQDWTSLNAQVKELSNDLDTMKEKPINERKTKGLETVMEDLNKSFPTEMAKSELEGVKNEISELDDISKNLDSKSVHFDPNEKKALFEKKEEQARVYRARKRLADYVIDAIVGDHPKRKKLDDVPVETDDDDKKL